MTSSNEADGFEWAFGLNCLGLDIVGVLTNENNNSRRWRNAIVTPTLVLAIFFGIILPQAHALVEVRRQLPLVADNLVTFNVCFVGMTKMSILWTGRKGIAKLLRRVYDDWLAEKSSSELRSMRRHAQHARLFTILSSIICLGCVPSYVILPFFNVSIRQINNITDRHPTRVLPVQSFYPYYDVYGSPVYELTCLHQIICGFVAATSVCVSDNFFGALVLHACGQCEILEATLQRLAASALTDGSTSFGEQLRRAVSRHVRIIRFVDDVESLFSVMQLVHVLYIVVCVGFLGFLCVMAFGGDAKSPLLIQVVSLVSTSFSIMLQSFIIYDAVEILATHSCRLLESTYLPSLHSMPKSRARDLSMIMMHSREPLKLTAGKILNLSLNTYLQLIKNVFGYISMLMAVNNSY